MSRWHREHPEAALADLLASPTGFPPGTRHLPAPPKPVEPEQAPSATEEPARKHRR